MMAEIDDTKKALIVSISDYSNLENLDFCKNDGYEMFDILSNLGYEIPSNRKLIGNVEDAIVKKAIVDFFRTTSNDTTDTLLFYFSGHGVLDGYEGRYFATSNINSTIPEENGIPFEFLTQQMDRSSSRKTIAILDCCFSGSAVPGATAKSGNVEVEAEKLGREALSKQFKNSKGKCILASSLSQRRSFNLPKEKMSAFTYFVVKGLQGRKESVDKEGFVTPEKLDEYVFSELSNLKGLTQSPVRNLSISGRLSLAHYPQLAQSKPSHKETLENSNYGFWLDVKNRIFGAIEEIEKNPLLDAFSKSAIESIPVVGVIFIKLYETCTLSNEQKTSHLLKIFNFINNLDEDKLEEFCRMIQKNRHEIIENYNYLERLSDDPYSLYEISTNSSDTSQVSSISVETPDQKIVENIPQNISEIYDHGISLFMDKKFEDAAKTFDQVTKLDPTFIDAIRFKGRALASLSRHQAAIFYFDQVLLSTSEDVVVLFLKAHSLFALDKIDESIECYDKILVLQPENKVALKKRNEIKQKVSKSRFGINRFRR